MKSWFSESGGDGIERVGCYDLEVIVGMVGGEGIVRAYRGANDDVAIECDV